MKIALTAARVVILALAFVQNANAQAQQEWGQCGGIGWTGPTNCVSGTVCTQLNPYYFQCLPGTATTTTTTTRTTTTSTTTRTSSTSSSTSSSSTSTTSSVPGSCSTPATLSGYSNAKLPNPFLFDDGTPVRTKADWTCRRAQISALIQGYEAGTLPPKPATVTGSLSGSTLTVTAANVGTTVSFTNTIKFPSGNPPTGGWPLVIAYEGGSIPIPSNIAVLSYPNSNIAQQTDGSSRGKGIFYNLYGSGHTASAMTAWVWGVSRIIDVLEITPSANINTQKIAVTGCSRDGKGALMAGAFETRIALTIPQESGSGGDACWRLSKYESDQGSQVQTATEIVSENVWFSANFRNYVSNLNALPYDHHLLAAMVAPRPLISYENTDVVWLSPMSSFGCMTATHTVYQALGIPDYHGFEQVGGHSHCAWPTSLTPTLNAFFNRFLLGQNTNTTEWSTNNQFNGISWTQSSWIDWTTPTLT